MLSKEQGVELTPDDAADDLLHLKGHYKIAFLVIFFFIAGLLIIQSYKQTHYDLSKYYFHDLSNEDRQRCSFYNWHETRSVTLDFIPLQSGMVTFRARNGEILFLTFAVEGVEQSIDFVLPSEIQEVFIHSSESIESVLLTDEGFASHTTGISMHLK